MLFRQIIRISREASDQLLVQFGELSLYLSNPGFTFPAIPRAYVGRLDSRSSIKPIICTDISMRESSKIITGRLTAALSHAHAELSQLLFIGDGNPI